MEDKERLLKLLQYSKEAIDFWFDGCDSEENLLEENQYYKNECKYFIDKIKEDLE